LDAGRLCICGEESFGDPESGHRRSVPQKKKSSAFPTNSLFLAWLNILAAQSPGKLMGINDLLCLYYDIYS